MWGWLKRALGRKQKPVVIAPRPLPTVPGPLVGRNYPFHIDAAFTDEEMEVFFGGFWVDCRSTWIQAARWDVDPQHLLLRAKGREYVFPGVDSGAALAFAEAQSKGRWYWTVWVPVRGRHPLMPPPP